jgi:hypothetical protein
MVTTEQSWLTPWSLVYYHFPKSRFISKGEREKYLAIRYTNYQYLYSHCQKSKCLVRRGARWWIRSFLHLAPWMRRLRVTKEALYSEERKRGRT